MKRERLAGMHNRKGSWKRIGDAVSRRLWFLDAKRLRSEAQHRARLEDFGEPTMEPAFSKLVESLENEAELRPLGRFLMRFHLRDLLETRLRLADLWSRHGAQEGVRIEKPLFIVGMPRSGSTFLHELLAEHPTYRAPRVWEVMFPVGSKRDSQEDRQRRIRRAEACLWWFRRLAPRADAVYPVRATTPHECVAIHSYTFLSEEFVSTCQIPSYENFLHGADLAPTYTWQKRFLQHLQAGSPRRRWVLKSPDHVHGLEALFSAFPDATIIQTHRNPVEVVKSSADLTRVLRGLYGPAGDVQATREREARVLAEATERFIAFRDAHPELSSRFIDVKYTELTSSPMETVERICERLEVPFTEPMRTRIGTVAVSRSRYAGPRASAESVGLKLATTWETDRFARYCTRFALAFRETDVSR